MENTPSLLDRHRPTADCAVGWMCRCAAHRAGAVRILLDPPPPPHPPAFLPGVALPLVACLPQLPVMGFLSNQQPCKWQSMGVNYLPIGGERPAAGWEGKCHKKAGAGSTWKEGTNDRMQGDCCHHNPRKTNFMYRPQKVVI